MRQLLLVNIVSFKVWKKKTILRMVMNTVNDC